MADEATTTATPAAPAAAPAAEATPAAPAKAPSLADLKAARRDKPATPAAPAAQSQQTPADLGGPPPAKAQATIDIDESALKQFSTLSRELREAKAKARDLEGKLEGFGKFQKAEALAKEGKHYDAAREAGIDVDAALAELLGTNNGQAPTAAQIDKKLAERLEAIEKKEEAREKAEAARKDAEAKAQVDADRKTTQEFVAKNVAKYPFLAKSPKLVGLAFEDYSSAKGKVEAEEGRAMTPEESTKLLLAALSVHEEDWANSLGDKKPEAAKPEAGGIDASARAGVRQPAPPAKKPKLTFEELKAERLAGRKAA